MDGPLARRPQSLELIDTYGIELLHPVRAGRSPAQIGRKGLSNHRWIVRGKLCLVLHHRGLVVAWDCAPANVHDQTFQPLIARFADQIVVLGDFGFHAVRGDSPNFKLCPRGHWNERMKVEIVLSMLALVCHSKKHLHRTWDAFVARLAFLLAASNEPVQWRGLPVAEDGFVAPSIAEFSL